MVKTEVNKAITAIALLLMLAPFSAHTNESEEAIRNEINRTVEIGSIKKSDCDLNFGMRSRCMEISMTVANTSNRTISGVRAVVAITDVFGRITQRVSISTDDDLKPNESRELSTATSMRRETERANQDKLTLEVEPFHIVFENGSELKLSKYE